MNPTIPPMLRALRAAHPVAMLVATLALGGAGAMASAADATPWELDSKRLATGPSGMDIVLREVERRPRVSVVTITVTKIGSSVGSSFFILCGIRQLAGRRGMSSRIAKIEQTGNPARMIVGFLASPDEDPASLGGEFANRPAGMATVDLQQFAPICERMPE